MIYVPPSKVEDYPAAIGRVAEPGAGRRCAAVVVRECHLGLGTGAGEDEHPMPAHERGYGCWPPSRRRWGLAFLWLRPAGLYKTQRHPGRFLAGETLEGGGQAVNLVHLDDVVAACQLLLAQERMAMPTT